MKNRGGFTLTELIITIIIIGAIGATVLLSTSSISTNSKIKATETARNTIILGLEHYKSLTSHYPASQSEFEEVLLNKHFSIFSSVPQNPFWNDNKNHPEKGWVWDPVLMVVVPVMPPSH